MIIHERSSSMLYMRMGLGWRDFHDNNYMITMQVHVNVFHVSTFWGFGSITAICLLSHGRRLPWSRPSRGNWCHLPNTLSNFGGNQSSPPTQKLDLVYSIRTERQRRKARRQENPKMYPPNDPILGLAGHRPALAQCAKNVDK